MLRLLTFLIPWIASNINKKIKTKINTNIKDNYIFKEKQNFFIHKINDSYCTKGARKKLLITVSYNGTRFHGSSR